MKKHIIGMYRFENMEIDHRKNRSMQRKMKKAKSLKEQLEIMRKVTNACARKIDKKLGEEK